MVLNLRFSLAPTVLFAFGVAAGVCLLGVLLWIHKHLTGWQRWCGPVLWLLGLSLWGVGFLWLGPYRGGLRFGTDEVSVSARGAVPQLNACLGGTALWVVGLLLSWRWARPVATADRQAPEQEGVWPPPPRGTA